jgi:broad specificity phosphatase PhoE
MRIFFARHGESQANILHEISNRGLKHPLTQQGREQATALARSLQDRSISYIYSSPLLRAIETTVILANHLCVSYAITDALREYDLGELEGRSDQRTWEIWQEVFDAWTKHHDWKQRAPGGEDLHQVKGRFLPFIEMLIDCHGGTDTNVLCLAHGGLYGVMLPQVLVNVNPQFLEQHGAFPYASFVVAELRPEGLVCLEWNGIRVNT